jgi:hypothetical protein
MAPNYSKLNYDSDSDSSITSTEANDTTESILVRPFDPHNLPTYEFTTYEALQGNNGTKKHKANLPIFDGLIPAVLLYLLLELWALATQNNFADSDYWEVFPQCLKDSARSKWTLIRNALALNQRTTVNHFRTAVNNYITEHYYPAGSRNLQLQSLRNVQQSDVPSGWATSTLIDQLMTRSMEFELIPSANNEVLSNNDIKNIVFRLASPAEQAELTRRFNGDITSATLIQIQQVLRVESQANDLLQPSASTKKSTTKTKTNNKKKRQQTKAYPPRKSNGNHTTKWGPDSICTKHPNAIHKWKNCRLNPRSHNYNPQYAQQWNARFGNGNNNNNNNYQLPHNQQQQPLHSGPNNNNNNNNNYRRSQAYGGPTHQGSYYLDYRHPDELPPPPNTSNTPPTRSTGRGWSGTPLGAYQGAYNS